MGNEDVKLRRDALTPEQSRELKQLAWDEDGLKVVDKDQADECDHINTWRRLLDELTQSQGEK